MFDRFRTTHHYLAGSTYTGGTTVDSNTCHLAIQAVDEISIFNAGDFVRFHLLHVVAQRFLFTLDTKGSHDYFVELLHGSGKRHIIHASICDFHILRSIAYIGKIERATHRSFDRITSFNVRNNSTGRTLHLNIDTDKRLTRFVCHFSFDLFIGRWLFLCRLRNNLDVFTFQFVGAACTFQNGRERIIQSGFIQIEIEGRFVTQQRVIVPNG